MTDKCTIFVTVPNEGCGLAMARKLVEEKLVACVSIIPKLTSIYQWKGKIEEASELLLLCKTRTDLFSEVEKRIKELHPYDVPEIIGHPIELGALSYLQWIDQSLGNRRES